MTEGPRIGKDEWVARHGENRLRPGGRLGVLQQRLVDVPWWAWLVLFVGLFALLPLPLQDGYWRQVAFNTVLFMLLALGLNVVVGWGGLLDLGYVAFYGLGAYGYALLRSDQLDQHWPTIVVILIVTAVGALAGLVVGLPSWRLSGDYLAIVTLFAFQIFNSVMLNGDDIFGADITGGVNGILRVDPVSVFGHVIEPRRAGIFNIAYLYLALGMFVIVFVLLRLVDRSRTGRAWRSLREDPLAAELMGMPVAWLKLLAFAFGAAVAALTGTLFAALNGAVFATNFELTLLITIYAMMILGGAGSQVGVVLGAILISVMLEFLREPGDARYVFYVVILLGLVATFRRSVRLPLVLVGTLLLGLVVRLVADAIDGSWTGVAPEGSGWLGRVVAHWVVVPRDLATWLEPLAYIGLIGLALALTLLRGGWRLAVLVPTLYVAAFVWENILAPQPEVTRFILLGGLLVATMVARPEGILGEKRVEVV
jgi:branched-chain amino acid transport system permease protein